MATKNDAEALMDEVISTLTERVSKEDCKNSDLRLAFDIAKQAGVQLGTRKDVMELVDTLPDEHDLEDEDTLSRRYN